MIYFLLFVLLFAAELAYFRIADRFNIIDKPNERSSYDYITIRGGGVIYWVAALLLMLMIKTSNLVWLGFLMVYGVDVVMTIAHRIALKQNIMEAHRLHFYQIMANEKGMPHRLVSVIYFVVQLACSALIVTLFPVMGGSIFVILLAVLIDIYLLKFKWMKSIKQSN